MKNLILFIPFLILYNAALCQQKDSLDNERLARMIDLSEVVVRTDINVPKFIDRVKNDTTFYKAFRNLRVLGFTSLNDIRIIDKKGKHKSSNAKQNPANEGRGLPYDGNHFGNNTGRFL